MLLLALLLAAGVGVFFTSDWVPQRRRAAADVVDLRPLQTARNLAALVQINPEREFAQEALRLADHEVDLAFAAALRNATERGTPTAQNKTLFARVQQTQAKVNADEAQIAQLKKALAAAPAAQQDDLQQQIALAAAQKELDDDELDDARQDLARAGGDAQIRIQRLLDEHNAQHTGDTLPAVNAQPVPAHLSAQIGLLNRLWGADQQLAQARDEAQAKAEALAQQHNQLEQQHAAPAAPAPAADTRDVATLKHLSSEQKTLAELDKRVQDEQQLRDLYGRWRELIQRRLRATAHRILVAVFFLLLLGMAMFIAGRVVERSLRGMNIEMRRLHTLRTVSRLAIQTLGLAVMLLIVFGPPSQLSTFIGLLSAGLAVILKDFIVAFFGWFVLMGKNGIRVGDWVEIEGVRGEVVEIGLLRTLLMETGNWSDAGHPTGRKVAFVNSFAVEGHYFNFSTVGQWLWDDLQVTVPHDERAYGIAEQIQKIVGEMTAENERLAREEWTRGPRHSGGEFSPTTAMSLRPTAAGIEVNVHYVTRAHERYQLRARMYQAIMDMLRAQRKTPAALSQAAE
ncbi:MAG TPA: mechanosensitive ion channel domain-containing protein [Terriglobales bacterium]|nr:mechanosensitive ion channel domain-containing protein [Terriglobales bacterium]